MSPVPNQWADCGGRNWIFSVRGSPTSSSHRRGDPWCEDHGQGDDAQDDGAEHRRLVMEEAAERQLAGEQEVVEMPSARSDSADIGSGGRLQGGQVR